MCRHAVEGGEQPRSPVQRRRDIHPALARHQKAVDAVPTTPTAGPAVVRSVPKFIREHAALVAAARLQAPPPALQEVG